MVWCPGWKVHSLGSHNFGTMHDKKTKFSGFPFFNGYVDLTKFKQNPLGSGGEGWLTSHGMAHGISLSARPVDQQRIQLEVWFYSKWCYETSGDLCISQEI